MEIMADMWQIPEVIKACTMSSNGWLEELLDKFCLVSVWKT